MRTKEPWWCEPNDWRYWASMLLGAFAAFVFFSSFSDFSERKNRAEQSIWMQCEHVVTGESFHFHSSTVTRKVGVTLLIDTNGWNRVFTNESLSDWRCRDLAAALNGEKP